VALFVFVAVNEARDHSRCIGLRSGGSRISVRSPSNSRSNAHFRVGQEDFMCCVEFGGADPNRCGGTDRGLRLAGSAGPRSGEAPSAFWPHEADTSNIGEQRSTGSRGRPALTCL